MKSYIISLKNENEPHNVKLKQKITDFGINPIWFNGLNGKTINMNQYKHHFDEFILKFLTPSQIGCALSHLYIWKKIAESEETMAIVFEDDVVFTKDFSIRFNNLVNNLPQNFDLLYLGWLNNNNYFLNLLTSLTGMSKIKEQQINKYLIKPKCALTTHAYIISKKGAQRLIKLLDGNLNNHIDLCINNLYLQDKIQLYSLKNRIAFQTSLSGKSSNISCNFPQNLYFFSDIYLDRGVPLSYIFNINIFRLGPFYITYFVMLSFFLGFLFFNINTLFIFLIIILFFIPDIKYVYNTGDKEYLKTFLLVIFLLLTPSLIKVILRK